ncbi:MFS transporter [Streptomyces sp. NBC_01443]|uniref:MFS transporter n=1 Tax=Streptomyces sp. NBC_01443 TaxID=2903868 RepID=UPI002250D5E1|nr:MFS transporter [Streptomyces sp. NBC_01443]MCX4627011.1 MFS transporter [Streptomyces sp. NBC_01443]
MSSTDFSASPVPDGSDALVQQGAAAAPKRPKLPLPPLVALSLGYFLVMLDVTVVNVAVPSIQSSLDVGPSGLQWIVDGYSTFFAGLLLLGGGLGDRFGHRPLYLFGLAVFTVASVGCALAPVDGVLIAARLAQGAGAAFLVPASFALLQAAYPDRALRARAVGIWGLVSAVAFGAGPAVGGLLVSGLDWRWVFWVNLPVAALAAAMTLRHVQAPARKRQTGRMDPAGQLLGVLGLVGVAGALNEAGSAGWTSPRVVTAFVLGVAALIAFVLVERHLEKGLAVRPEGRKPLLPLSLFRDRRLTTTNVIGLLLSLGYYGMLFVATLYFQQERGFSALETGLALLPSVCMGFLAAPLSSRVTARTGPYVPMTGALLLGVAGFLGWLTAGPETPYPVLLFALMATGLATPVTVVAATVAIMEAAPAEGAGVASAVFNVSRQAGNAIGVALFGTLIGATGRLPGLHVSALIAAGAFLIGSVLAGITVRRLGTGSER